MEKYLPIKRNALMSSANGSNKINTLFDVSEYEHCISNSIIQYINFLVYISLILNKD